MKKTIYVCGFCFDYSRKRVALIKKNRPNWQKGLLNGIGGHIEAGENLNDAIRREFKEETGVDIWSWDLFCTYEGKDYVVYFMKIFSSMIGQVKTVTDEKVKVLNISDLNNESDNGLAENRTIDNLKWLIPLALDVRVDKTNCVEYITEPSIEA